MADSTQPFGTEQHPYLVCIIGGGLSGVCMALQLSRNNTIEFVLYESSNNVGGTWASNQWPGSECDIQSLLYSYSFVTDYVWKSQYATYSEICSYIQHCINKYNIQSNIQCNTTVTNVHWLNDQQLYQVTTIHKGQINTVYTKYIVNAFGVLRKPTIPTILNSDQFHGQSFHSARYDHTVNLQNKRVALIGTGASAISIATAIQPMVKQLYIYQRTPQYVVPRLQYKFSTLRKLIYQYIPLVQKFVRTMQYFFNDSIVLGSRYKLFSLNQSLQRLSIDYMYSIVHNTQLQQQLQANYTIGCKRILLSDTFYNTVQQSNVKLITSSIQQFTSDSIVTSHNETHNIDIVIYCTGFDTYANNIKIAGLPDIDIDKQYCSMYRGVTQLYRPNMFSIMGYNTVVSHNSTVTQIESACTYIINAMKYCNQYNIKSLQIKSDQVAEYNKYIQHEISQTVFSTQSDCTSWFMTPNHTERINTASWPLFAYNYYIMMQSFDCNSYEFVK